MLEAKDTNKVLHQMLNRAPAAKVNHKATGKEVAVTSAKNKPTNSQLFCVRHWLMSPTNTCTLARSMVCWFNNSNIAAIKPMKTSNNNFFVVLFIGVINGHSSN